MHFQVGYLLERYQGKTVMRYQVWWKSSLKNEAEEVGVGYQAATVFRVAPLKKT
jgi:hypothetical protein